MKTTQRISLITGICAIGLAPLACRTATVASEPSPASAASMAAVPQTADMVPAGTTLRAQLNQQISTETSRAGDRFTATVVDNLVAANGQVAVPAGSVITGVVQEVKPSSHVGEQAHVRLRFDTLAVRGNAVPIDAQLVEANVQQDRRGRDVATGAGAGALGGAALGAILGGGSGALKGGLIGAGGGTLVSLGAGDVQAKLPAGTVMTLRMASPVSLY